MSARTILPLRCLARDRSGASAVEFALVFPMLAFLLTGMVSYGWYFWTAHSLQHAANDAARAAIAGLTAPERAALAEAAFAAHIENAALDPALASLEVAETGARLTLAAQYDASGSAAFVLKGLTPMPSAEIRRDVSIELGGF